MSKHFTLEEFLVSDTAKSIGVSNYPSWEIVDSLRRLSATMEMVRRICGNAPVTVSSGYRSPPVNQAVGGAANSAHLYGLACDFVIPGCGTPFEVCEVIKPFIELLGVDQLIYEGSWVHLGLCASGEEPRGDYFQV